jgi:hypothetical protein
MSEKICRTCRHWSPPENEGDIAAVGLATCQNARQYWDASKWDYDAQDKYIRVMKDKEHRVFVQDGSDYHAYLITREDFFCADWSDQP